MTAATSQLRFWIDMAMECVRRDHTPTLSSGDQKGPFLTARALGMALGALNDAHALSSSRATLMGIPATAGLTAAIPDVAAAAACAQVLRLRYPNQAHLCEPAWQNWLEYFGFGPAGSSSEVAGRAFGTAVHMKGAADPANAAADQYTPSGAAYTHDRPPNQPTQSFAGAKWGLSTPLVATRVSTFPPPPGRASAAVVNPTAHYSADFAKVAVKGIIDRMTGLPSPRSLPEEVIGVAWGYDGPPELGTPPRLYLQVVLEVLDSIEARMGVRLTPVEELSVVAAIGIAMADAAIDAWHYKYAPTHMMWRPVVGIRKAVPGNGVADPDWLPFGRPDTNGSGKGLTPDFPAYPSGHATFGSAAFQLLRLFLVQKGLATFDPNGVDDITFDFVSDEFNGRNKSPVTMQPREHLTLGYDSLWRAIIDNSVSRVFLGVHWQFDGVTKRTTLGGPDEFGVPSSPAELGQIGGVWLGAKIANQIAPRLGVTPATIAASRIV